MADCQPIYAGHVRPKVLDELDPLRLLLPELDVAICRGCDQKAVLGREGHVRHCSGSRGVPLGGPDRDTPTRQSHLPVSRCM